MTASLSWRSGVIGGGRTRDVTQQQVLESAMAEKRDGTTTTATPEEDCAKDDEWRKLYDGVDDGDDNDVFVNNFNDDVGFMFSDVERQVFKCFHCGCPVQLCWPSGPFVNNNTFWSPTRCCHIPKVV